jgi:hypothetical protein
MATLSRWKNIGFPCEMACQRILLRGSLIDFQPIIKGGENSA